MMQLVRKTISWVRVFFSPAPLCVFMVCSALCSRAYAAEPEPEPSKPQARLFGPSGDVVLDTRAAELGHKLRCPVCQGMPIAESPATMAVDMMQQVRKMLAAGHSDADIMDYFTSRYGQWVLLEPPHDGFALWVWVLPPLCAAALLALALRLVRRLGASPTSMQPAPHTPPHTADAPRSDAQAAQMLAAIRREVDES
jgi:cytochrome c-type biogenesis protein CcmH